MTPTQYQRMGDRYERYRALLGFKEQLETQLERVRNHGGGGLNIEFVGVSCKMCLYKEVSERLLPEIESVFKSVIADCVSGMEAIDTEIGN